MIWFTLVACHPAVDRTLVYRTVDGAETEVPSTSDSTPDPDPVGPEIDGLSITELPGEIAVRLEISTGDAEVLGGAVLVDLDGQDLELTIPNDLVSWVGGVAELRVDRPGVGGCSLGVEHQLSVRIVDVDGRRSGAETAVFTTTDVGVVVDEIGETEAVVLGQVNAETLVCGTLASTGNDGEAYTADLDFATFEVDPSGGWSLRLDWQAGADYDLTLYTVSPGGRFDPIAQSATPADQGPEEILANLTRGDGYAFLVAGWSGAAGEWTVAFE